MEVAILIVFDLSTVDMEIQHSQMAGNSPLDLDLSLLDNSAFPAQWDSSWDNPRDELRNCFAQNLVHINEWITTCSSTIYPIPKSRTDREAWLIWLLSDTQVLRHWLLLVQESYQARCHRVDSFWQSFAQLELFPYLVGLQDPQLLSVERPRSPTEGFATFDEAIERLGLLLEGLWTPAQRSARVMLTLARQDLAEIIRQAWSELLPGQSTLVDLVKFEPNLVHFVGFLMTWAQRRLSERPTNEDLHRTFLRAFARTEKLAPFASLAVFDPLGLAPKWSEVSAALISEGALHHFLDTPQPTPGLSKKNKSHMLDTLLRRASNDIPLKRKLLRYIDLKVAELGLPSLVLSVRRARVCLFPELCQPRVTE